MSKKHPIIAVTGSSGAGTTTVKVAFEHIFFRLQVNTVSIEGDSIDRIKLRHANRLYSSGGNVTREDLARIDASDILKSRVFAEVPELDGDSETPTEEQAVP